jgi:hypothetical protein
MCGWHICNLAIWTSCPDVVPSLPEHIQQYIKIYLWLHMYTPSDGQLWLKHVVFSTVNWLICWYSQFSHWLYMYTTGSTWCVMALKPLIPELHSPEHMRGSQKVPGMVVLHCNGRTYGNAYLITSKLGPLRTHTLAPSILPLLETLAEGFFWNLPSSAVAFDLISSMVAKHAPWGWFSE